MLLRLSEKLLAFIFNILSKSIAFLFRSRIVVEILLCGSLGNLLLQGLEGALALRNFLFPLLDFSIEGNFGLNLPYLCWGIRVFYQESG